MTLAAAERAGVRHLAALARCPRPAGGSGEQDARAYAAQHLTSLGFTVCEEGFAYSSFPGRFGTPIAGAALAVTVATASWFALIVASPRAAGVALIAGIALTAGFARAMFVGVLAFPWLRAKGMNVTATRGKLEPRVWLVAHLDSKSQPIPSIVRVAGVVLLVAGVLLALSGCAMTLAGYEWRMLWWGALWVALAGAGPAMASLVGERSDGAVDNASGVATVLAAATMVQRDAACGVLLTSAEELGLAGARAWVLAHAPALALNCDGVDDEGNVVIMFNGRKPTEVVGAVRAVSPATARVRRMPLGLLTDSSAFSAAGWPSVTVSHGSLATLRRIHTPHDTLNNLRGSAIDDVAIILARAAEELAQ